ncbi:erythroferrone isoform X2 [Phyllopteryx taeniolatus]|uniref:erythroferrone isoform X2 n=1 Tax=Phyllopteryx taeniolatus TaxID=161469 RepID=UPI002AD5A31F|nr:erythroferrone isoform X2 [Phyllopteryx taeniolatus]
MTGPNMKTRPIGIGCHLIVMMMMMMMMMIVSSSQEVQDDGVVQDSTPSEGSPLSPRSTWMMFIKNSQAQKRNSRRTAKLALRGPRGPRGPPGPPGPPCPPAPRPHPQQILDDVLTTLTGGVSFCALCHRPPRIPASFLGLLRRTVEVARRSLMELRPFTQAPPSACGFQRGSGFNVSDGRYTAMRSGFYLLTARLRLQSGERVQVRHCESVTAAICVGSLCHTNLSIESVVGVASVGGAFSISLTGTLFLQAGEYASVYVDNAAGANISVMPDSFFSAILLGI